MVTAADVLGLSSGYKFEPDDDEVVEYYLLPRLLGQKSPLEGMILEDDPLSASPWELLRRHQREDDAFFFAQGHMIHGKGSRKKRTCVGGGCWEGQKVSVDDETLIVPDSGTGTGTEISWRKYQLNFHNDGEKGSTGWVMHEYSVTAPPDLASSSLRLYRIRFSGHGQKRKREPDDLGLGARAATRQAVAESSNLLEEHISASNSAFPEPQDGYAYGGAANCGNQWPATVTSSDQEQDYLGVKATDDHHLGVGPAAASYQAAPAGVIHEFAGADGAAPVAGTLPLCHGSHSSAIEPIDLDFELPENIDLDFDFELPDNIDLDGFLAWDLEAQLNGGQFSGAGGMQTQPMPNSYDMSA